MKDNLEKKLHLHAFFRQEAEKCAQKGAYLMAGVAIGSSVEAALLAMCEIEKEAVWDTGYYKKKDRKILKYNLGDLLEIAKELDWFSEEKEEEVERWVDEILRSEVRNAVHPGVLLRLGREPENFEKDYYEFVKGIGEYVNKLLKEYNEKELERLERITE